MPISDSTARMSPRLHPMLNPPPDRPVLVMLPALPCDARFYAAQIDALSDLVDPRVVIPEERSMAASAAAVLASAPARFLLAGTAYGGCLAIEIAVTAPDRVAGLWLMNCSPGVHPDPDEARQLCSRVRSGGFEAVLDDWAQTIVAEEATAAREEFLEMARAAGPDRFANQYEASAGRSDHWDHLNRISMPILLLWGEDDQFVPVEIGRRMAEAMPTARIVSLPGCRHFPALEQPGSTNRAARAWLKTVLPISSAG